MRLYRSNAIACVTGTMTVFRRIKRIYRCRCCCVRFAVLIATALLCALEAVKYKNRLKITGETLLSAFSDHQYNAILCFESK